MPRTIFRVFFSSTFGDFQAEREKLRAEVWPRLEALCASHGASFHVVDLRWGISPSVATTHDTIQICLDEVKRCQELSPFPKPNFLMLIGDRYGWRPPAVEIPDADFQVIKKAASKDDAAFLTSWYRKDENAVPPVWLLKPREGEYQDYNAWGPVENRLVSIQHDVSEKLNLSPEKYLYSATHMEIVDGLLKLEGVQDHIFSCNRELKGLPAPAPKGIARRFADYLPDGSRDPEAVSQLSVLKEQIAAVLPDSQVHLYSADWLGDESKPISTSHLEQLCADVEASLLNVIRPELDQMAATTPLEEELEGQRQFLAETGRLLIGRDKELNKIRSYLGKKKTLYPLIIQATGGCGKSAIMAKAVMEQEGTTGLIYRFIGASPRSWQPQSFLEDLIVQVAQTFGQETPTFPEEGGIKALGELLNEQLQLATEEQPLTILIDAIDQFSSTSAIQYRDIFPEELPDNVRMVISVLNGKDADQLNALYPKSPRIKLEPLSPTACGKILDALLHNRKLTREQRATILDKAKESGLPLWLTLAAPIARKLRSWDTTPDLPSDIKELARYVVKRIAVKHGPVITTASIRYIKLARYGLSETELQEILWADPDVRAEFNATKNPDQPEVTELPPIFWSRLYAELDPYINEYWMDGQLLHRYFHRVFGEVADEMEEETRKELHSRLAEHFNQQPLYLEQQPNGRKLMELPYHLSLADRIQEARDTITDFDFAMAKCRLNRSDDWVHDFFKASAAAKSREYRIWESFVKTNAHILRRGNADWPAHKILLQLAIEHADDSPATIGAEKFLTEGKCDWAWLRRELRVKHAGIDPCLAVFEGHKAAINGALEISDKMILSWASDIRLWDKETGKCLRTLTGHTDHINGVSLLENGNFISWSKDNTIRLWSQDGVLIIVFEGHTESVEGVRLLNNGCFLSCSLIGELILWSNGGVLLKKMSINTSDRGPIILPNGNILTWSNWFSNTNDYNLKLWSQDGEIFKIMEGHSKKIFDVSLLSDYRIVSRACNDESDDDEIHIWSQDGELLEADVANIEDFEFLPLNNDMSMGLSLLRPPKVSSKGHKLACPDIFSTNKSTFYLSSPAGESTIEFAGHSKLVRGAVFIDDNTIFSWSDDCTLRFWAIDGKLLGIFRGHSAEINGLLILSNKQILTWSNDSNLRIWSLYYETGDRIESHTESINGVLFNNSNRLISWSRDSTIRIWSNNGESLRVLEGHKRPVNGVLPINDELLLSWSSDSLKIWSVEMELIRILEGLEGFASGAILIPGNRILAWSLGEDTNLLIWSLEGELLHVLNGHSFHVHGAILISENRILSWSEDKTLIIWNMEGKFIKTLSGHSGGIENAIQLPNDRLLSWTVSWSPSPKRNLIMWTENGELYKSLEGHTKAVLGCTILPDDQILTWSEDTTLIIWSSNGELVEVLEGHTDEVQGALLIQGTQILSWSSDSTLRLWSLDGKLVNTYQRDSLFEVGPIIWKAFLSADQQSTDSGIDSYITKVILGTTDEQLMLWQAQSVCKARKLFSDGRAIITQSNGEVCFLKTYHGNRPVTLEDMRCLNSPEFKQTTLQ